MDKIFENQEVMVLSNKVVTSNNGRILTFEDGSSVDIFSRKIINKGAGEIIIKDLPLWPTMTEIVQEQKIFQGVRHLNVSGDMNNIVILPNEGFGCEISLGGSDDFVQNTSIYQQGDLLYIETPRSKSNVHINIGSIWVNGKRLPPQLEEGFGYIEIKCNSLYSIFVHGNGTGDIYLQVPISELKAKIKGSTSIDAIKLETADIDISGSGSLIADELSGWLRGRISGSGSIDILTGEVDNVEVEISGSGDLVMGATIKTATLFLSGSGDMLVAHVLDEYTEQKTGSGSIRVLRKGRPEI